MRLTISRSGLGRWATLPLRFFRAVEVWGKESAPTGKWRSKAAGCMGWAAPGAGGCGDPRGTRAVEVGFSARDREAFNGSSTEVEGGFIFDFGFWILDF